VARYVATRSQLAQAIPLGFATLLEYFRLPGRPKDRALGAAKYDIEAWRKFVALTKSGHYFNDLNGHVPATGGNINERVQSIIEKNKIAAAAAQFDLNVKMGEFVRRLDVNRDIDTGNAIVKRELVKLVTHVLPVRLDGITSPAARAKIGMAELNKVFKLLPGHIEKAASVTNGS
jgi:hypothetical protein